MTRHEYDRFRLSHELFEREVYSADGPVVCNLHQAFGTHGTDSHNCLGCNFAEVVGWVRSHLRSVAEATEVADAMSFYLLKLYLFVERVHELFEIVKLPDEYKGRHFTAFRDVYKWANFLKHPKAFLLVHHPTYCFEGAPGVNPSNYALVIDQNFVNEYYSGTDKNGPLYKLLKNGRNIAVQYPDPLELTRRFCAAIKKFVSVIEDNSVYREVLDSRTTYENYFTELDVKAQQAESAPARVKGANKSTVKSTTTTAAPTVTIDSLEQR